jgi:hypothetical protein
MEEHEGPQENAQVIDLAGWRHQHGAGDDAEHERLADAVDRLERAIGDRGWDAPPPWLVTELLAVQGCLSLGLPGDAAWRIERLAQRTERLRPVAR